MRFHLIFFFISFSTYALTEKDIVSSVLNFFPLIEEAELKVRSAQGELTSAEGAFDHKLVFKSRNRIEEQYDNQYFEATLERQTAFGGANLVAGHRQGLGNFPSYDGKYRTSGAGEIFAGLSVPLLRNLQTDEFRTNLKIKQIDNKQAQLQLELKKMIYLHKALSLYYKWVLETQKLKINKSILELAKMRHEMIQKKFSSGDIDKFKVVDNQRAIDKRTGDVIKNEIELNKIRAQLSLYVRNESGEPVVISLDYNPDFILQKNETALFKNDINNNPQVKILEMEKEKLKLELAFFEQSRLPGLNVELLGAKEMSVNYAYDPESLQVGLKFDFPLENRKAEGKTVAYNYKLQALDRNRQYLEGELGQQLNFFIQASADSKARWEVTNKEFEGAKKIADAEKSRWTQGASDLFIVNLREQDVADVDIRRWTALYDYHQYHLDARLFSATIMENSSGAN
jgi:cobalt-zinc-cadmium efflux system outer membrane protein